MLLGKSAEMLYEHTVNYRMSVDTMNLASNNARLKYWRIFNQAILLLLKEFLQKFT